MDSHCNCTSIGLQPILKNVPSLRHQHGVRERLHDALKNKDTIIVASETRGNQETHSRGATEGVEPDAVPRKLGRFGPTRTAHATVVRTRQDGNSVEECATRPLETKATEAIREEMLLAWSGHRGWGMDEGSALPRPKFVGIRATKSGHCNGRQGHEIDRNYLLQQSYNRERNGD